MSTPATFWCTKPTDWSVSIDAREIVAPDQEIDVLGIPHRFLVDPRHPGRDGVPADNHVGNAGRSQGADCSTGSFPNVFHGGNHPLPGEIV